MIIMLKPKIKECIKQVEDWLALHAAGKAAPLSTPTLKSVHFQLNKMLVCMNPKLYQPSYPKFLIDCWQDSEINQQAVNTLNSLATSYNKINHPKGVIP